MSATGGGGVFKMRPTTAAEWAYANSPERTGGVVIYNHAAQLVDGVVEALCYDPNGKCPYCNGGGAA